MTTLYLVNKTQPSKEYYDKTICVLSDYNKAVEYARTLNKEYGENCEFSKEGDFIKVNDDVYFESAHFYTVESMELDEELA